VYAARKVVQVKSNSTIVENSGKIDDQLMLYVPLTFFCCLICIDIGIAENQSHQRRVCTSVEQSDWRWLRGLVQYARMTVEAPGGNPRSCPNLVNLVGLEI
jgi:hypothetical protein